MFIVIENNYRIEFIFWNVDMHGDINETNIKEKIPHLEIHIESKKPYLNIDSLTRYLTGNYTLMYVNIFKNNKLIFTLVID